MSCVHMRVQELVCVLCVPRTSGLEGMYRKHVLDVTKERQLETNKHALDIVIYIYIYTIYII